MKNLSLILAMIFLAFTVEAQNIERTKRTSDKKKAQTSVNRSSNKSSKVKKTKAPSSSRTSSVKSSRSSNANAKATPVSRKRVSRSSSSSSRPSVVRKPSNTSRSSAVRSSNSRSSSSSKPQVRKTTSARTSRNVSRSVSNQRVNTSSPKRSENRTGTRVVNARGNQSSQSVRGKAYAPRTSVSDAASRKVYVNNYSTRVRRIAPSVHYKHQSLDYRRVHNPYNRPKVIDIYWNANMYRNYRNWYPSFNLWYYPYGYRIHTISAYDSYNYIGEVARVYGRVSEVWYSNESREYYLYIGGQYPYQDFTIILKSRDARRFSWNPVRYFTNRDLTVTGLLSLFEDKPEMQIRRRSQISLYY